MLNTGRELTLRSCDAAWRARLDVVCCWELEMSRAVVEDDLALRRLAEVHIGLATLAISVFGGDTECCHVGNGSL